MQFFKTGKVVCPVLSLFAGERRIGELQFRVTQVVAESLPGESFHVFHDESFRPCLADCTDKMWDHVTVVFHAAMFAPDAEGLAGRSTGH